MSTITRQVVLNALNQAIADAREELDTFEALRAKLSNGSTQQKQRTGRRGGKRRSTGLTDATYAQLDPAKGKSARTITDALTSKGIKSGSANFTNTVTSTLGNLVRRKKARKRQTKDGVLYFKVAEKAA